MANGVNRLKSLMMYSEMNGSSKILMTQLVEGRDVKWHRHSLSGFDVLVFSLVSSFEMRMKTL